jgi:hypothetical protein
MHANRKIGLRRSDEQMKVIVEQHVGEDPPFAAFGDTIQQPHPFAAIIVVHDDVSLFEAAIHDVV